MNIPVGTDMTYRPLAELRKLGVVGTRHLCPVCRRYSNFAPGATYSPTLKAIACKTLDCRGLLFVDVLDR